MAAKTKEVPPHLTWLSIVKATLDQTIPDMEILDVPLFDDDIYKLIVRFCFNAFFVTLVVVINYWIHQKKKNYVFTYFMMNVMTFFICFTLKKLELGLGMALGLFAIFAIIRYRTDQIKIKEMTYLFVVIGIAAINALSNKKTSYLELGFANFAIFVVIFILERFAAFRAELEQSLVYDNLDLVTPEKRKELLADLKKRTGLNIHKVDVKKIDFMKGTANIVAYYR